MNRIDQAKYKFKMANVVEKIIVVNVLVFVLMYLFQEVFFLFEMPAKSISDWLVFSKDPEDLLYKPWSIITYAFLHQGILHIFFNMLILYYFGNYFLNYFTPKRLLNFYFLGAIAGAMVYLLSYNFFPVFSGVGQSYMLGASASVMAILVGIATKVPNLGVRLFLFGTVKLWHIAAVFIVLDLVRMPNGNAGGHLAHIGGALLGYVYVKQLNKGKDIGAWWESLSDWFVGLFSSSKKKPFRTVHRNTTSQKGTPKSRNTSGQDKDENQKKIDTILDKISKSGYDSLSREEKDFLFKSGNEH